jgi:hypothetical protein
MPFVAHARRAHGTEGACRKHAAPDIKARAFAVSGSLALSNNGLRLAQFRRVTERRRGKNLSQKFLLSSLSSSSLNEPSSN